MTNNLNSNRNSACTQNRSNSSNVTPTCDDVLRTLGAPHGSGTQRALEPRILLDAAAATTFADAVEAQAQSDANDWQQAATLAIDQRPGIPVPIEQENQQTDQNAQIEASATEEFFSLSGPTDNTRTEIVFIDASIEGLSGILDSISSDTEIIMIDPDRDGVRQIAAALSGRSDIDSIHIISHGRAGVLDLGSAKLTQATITGEYASTLALLGESLSETGDILIYGCNFGQFAAGAEAVVALARATGADVAASDDLTGAALLGGDWDLERTSGEIETKTISAQDWQGTLAPFQISASAPPTSSGGTALGAVGLWSNAGTVGGQSIDVTATVVSVVSGLPNVTFDTIGDDLRVVMNNAAEVVIRWEVFESGTNQTVSTFGDPNLLIKDLDGSGSPETIEVVAANAAGLASYTVESVTNLVVTTPGGTVRASGTQNQSTADTEAWVRYKWVGISSWEINYRAYSGGRFFDHDADGDLSFVNPNTTVLNNTPTINLDPNNSGGGIDNAGFETVYNRGASAVAVADSDANVDDLGDADIVQLQIVLSGVSDGASEIVSIAGQAFASNFSTTQSGVTIGGSVVDISYNSTTGTFTITNNTGSSNPIPQADLDVLVQSVTYQNTNGTPTAGVRTLTFSARDSGGIGTEQVVASVNVVANVDPVAVNDTNSTTEETILSVNAANGVITPNDTDVNLDTLSVTQVNGSIANVGNQITLTSGALLTLNANGSYDYDPNGAFNSLPAGQSTTDSFTYQVSDGNGGTDTATVTITINGVNDLPSLSNDVDGSSPATADNFEATYVENALGIKLVDVDSAVTDADNDIVELVVTLIDGKIGDTINFPSSLPGNISAAVFPLATLTAPGTITITFTGDASTTNANWNTVLQALTFLPSTNDVHNPDPADRNFTFQVSDSASAFSNITNTTIHVTPENDVPTLDLDDDNSSGLNAGNFQATFVENSGGVPIQSNIIMTDLDNTNFQSATVTLANTQTDDQFKINGTPVVSGNTGLINGIAYAVSTGGSGELVITLTGSATISDYDSALELIQFNNTSENPDTTQRVINVVVNDGINNTATRTAFISVQRINDAPVLDLDNNDSASAGTAYQATYTENDVATAMADVDLNIADPDDTQLESAVIVLTNAMAGDLLEVGTLPAGIVASINTAIPGEVTVTLTGTASVADYETAMKAVTFRSTSENPDTTDRLINFTVNDGDINSNTAQSTMYVTAVNDAPVVVSGIADQTSNDGNTTFSLATAANFSDVDNSVLTYTLDAAAPAWLTINNNTGLISLVGSIPADASQNTNIVLGADGTYDLTVTARDPAGLTVQDTFRISIANLAPIAVNDTSTGDENITQTGNVITDAITGDADTAPDTDVVTVTAITGGTVGNAQTLTYGDLTISSTGAWSFVPNATANALALGTTVSETVTYTISDGQGGTDTATLVISIVGSNDVPIIVDPANPNTPPADPNNIIPDVFYTDGETIATINASQFISDPDGDTLTFSATQLPPGLSINAITGEITGTPDADASKGGTNPATAPGVYNVVIRGLDPHGASVTTTVDFTITNVAPIASDDTATTNEDTSTTGNVLTGPGADTDGAPDFDVLVVSQVDGVSGNIGKPIAGSSGGVFTLNADGTWFFDPKTDFGGLATGQTRDTSITYQVSDGNGGFDEATLTIVVTGLNDAPTFGGPLPPQTVNDGAVITPVDTTTAFNNPNNDVLTYTTAGLPAGLVIDSVTGIISGTIDSSASLGGTYSVVITAIMPGGQSVESTIIFIVNNVDPVANDDVVATGVSSPVNIIALANDNDGAPDADTLSISQITVAPTNGTAVLNADGSINYTPNVGFSGLDTITYEVSDAQGGTDTATITIEVGLPSPNVPTSTPLATQSYSDGETIPATDVSGSFTDSNGDPLVYTANGLPAGLVLDSNTGLITGTLDADASQNGPYIVQITVVDTAGNQTTQPMTINVANPLPIAANDTTSTTLNTAVNVVVLANDLDPDGDTIIVVLINDQPANGVVAINPDGTVTYTPNLGFTGADTFTYILEDANGGRSEATVTVNVGIVDPGTPTATTLPGQTITDGTAIPPINVTGSFTDPNGDPLNYTASGLPSGLSINSTSGIISGTPASDASTNSPYTAHITAIDPSGNQVTIAIVLTVTNPAPVATPDSATTVIDTPVTISVLNNDHDPDGDAFDVTGTTPPANGSIVLNANGSITYTPNLGFVGTDTFTYTISDAQGITDTETVTVITAMTANVLTANPVIAPVAASDGATPTSLDISKVIIDPDGDPLVWSATNLPAGLTISSTTGVISGTLDNSASQAGVNSDGRYLASISARDPGGNIKTVTIEYEITNLAPEAVNDVSSGNEDTVQSGNVITHATTGDADTAPDSDAITVTAVSGGVVGTVQTLTYGDLTINSNGDWTFTPNATANALPLGAIVTEVVTYTIEDGEGGSDTATLTITLTGVNDVPVIIDPANPGTPPADPDNIIPDVTGTDGETPTTLRFADFVNDVDGDTLIFSATDLPPGLSINSSTGEITGTISAVASQQGNGGAGIYNVVLSATDPTGARVTTTLTYTITNLAPIALDDISAANEDTTQSGNVITNTTSADADAGPDSDPLTVIGVSGGIIGSPQIMTYGNLTLNADGSWNFVPNAAANALPAGSLVTQTVTYAVSDGQGGTDTATLTITVNGLNDAPVATAMLPELSDFPGIGVEYPLATFFNDIDGDILRYSATGLPTGLAIDPATGIISGIVSGTAIANSPGRDGVFEVTVFVDDGNGGMVSVNFTYTINSIGVPAQSGPPDTLPPFGSGPPQIDNGNNGELDSNGLIISSVVDGIASLGSDSSIFNYNQVLTKILSQIDPLGAFTQLSDAQHPIENLINWVNETRDLLARSNNVDGGAYADNARYLGGDAIGSAGEGNLMARSLVLQKTAMIELFGDGFDPENWDVSIKDQADNPVWLQNIDGKVMIILRPVNLEQITFIISGPNGILELTADLVTGQLEMKNIGERVTRAPIFSEQIHQMVNADQHKIRALF